VTSQYVFLVLNVHLTGVTAERLYYNVDQETHKHNDIAILVLENTE